MTVSTDPGAEWGCLAGPGALSGCKVPGPYLTEYPSPSGLTALHVAVNTECHEAVLLLLERGADIDAVVSARARASVGPRGAGPKGGGAGVGERLPGWVRPEVSNTTETLGPASGCRRSAVWS